MNLPKEGGGMDSRLEMLNQAIKSNGEQLTRLEGDFKETKEALSGEIKDMQRELRALESRQINTEGDVRHITAMLSKIDVSVENFSKRFDAGREEQLRDFKGFVWKVSGGLATAYFIAELINSTPK